MSKIVIIRTPFIYPSNHVTSITVVPDIGTAYICGNLQKAGHDCFIIDAAGESIGKSYRIKNTNLEILGLSTEEIIERIPKDVDLIGVQAMHSNRWINDACIIQRIIRKFPKAKVFIGGEHASACAKSILKQIPEIYACVIGEGEQTAMELVNALEKNLPIDDIQGIAFVNKNKEVVVPPRRKRQLDLGRIEKPAWINVPIKKYLDNHCGINSRAKRAIPMLATRGCPHSCTFCTAPSMWDSKWCARPAVDVINEIKTYINDFGVDHIDFVDLTIVMSNSWMQEFCNLLIKENLDITWAIPIGTRTENIDKELLILMKKSGLARVLFSAESGSENTLDRINKKLNIKHFNKVVRQASKLGVCVKVALIFGFPGQKIKDIFGSFLLLNKLIIFGINDVVCLSFIPYPATDLYHELGVEYDFNSLDNNIRLNNDIANMKSWSEYFGDTFLKFTIWFFILYFYIFQGVIRPNRVILGVWRVCFTKKPLTNIESMIYNMISAKKSQKGEVVFEFAK